jgi:hypothetical protein
MFRLDLICFTNSGINAARITTVNPMIDSTHENPEAGPKTDPNTWWNPDSNTEVIQYSGVMTKLPIWPRNENTQAP